MKSSTVSNFIFLGLLAFISLFSPFAHGDCVAPPSGLVGWWPAEGNANDIIGTNNGTLSSSGAGYAPAMVGMGFRLDGTSGYVEIPYSEVLEPTNLTLETWVWFDPDANTNPTTESIIFKQNSWPDYFEGYSLCRQSVQNSDGTYTSLFQFVVSRDGDQVIIYSTTVAQRGVWYHVAATYDGNQTRLYVDGAAEASAIAGFPLDYGSEPVYFGTTGTPPPYADMLAGIIDEPSIYDRALGSNEIAAIYNAGSAGKCSSLEAPSITTQPTNQTVSVGGTATFGVVAAGSSPLIYQWLWNGISLGGATNPVLTLANVQSTNTGNYSVIISNVVGSIVSSNAGLTVLVPATAPFIISQTPDQVVLLSNTFLFSVTVGGSLPLSYFWSRDGVLIPGATNAVYSLPSAQLSDSGSSFGCLVTNAYGTASSTNVSLKVLDTVSNDLCSGAVVITDFSYTNTQSTLDASSYGDPVPDCIDGFGNGVWYQFTSPVSGLLYVDTFGSDYDTGLAAYTGSCDSLTEVACNDDTDGVTSQVIVPTTAGTTYYFLAGGYDGHVGNLVIHLNFLTPPAFVLQPTNLSVVISSNAVFSPTLSGTQPISFQWYYNNLALVDGGRISGSTSSTLIIAAVQTSDAGNYQLVASNFLGVVTSSVAVLTPVILPPTFIQPPVDQSVLVGSNANFSAVAGGTPPFNYQWYFNGNALTDDGVHLFGSATASLVISNLISADAGSYSLTVSNVSGTTNAAAILTVLAPSAITVPPVGRSVPPGLPTIFIATATGVPTPSYQWQLNGTNIPGATSEYYTNSAVGTNDLGFYQLVASNSFGSAVSAPAQLTFGPVAAWGANSSGQCLPPPGLSNVVSVGGSIGASFALRADGSIVNWGSGEITNLLAGETNAVAVSVSGDGSAFAVLRADGTVTGLNPVPPGLTNVVEISVGGSRFGYALRAEGTLIGWGFPLYTNAPAGLNHVAAVACGYAHTLALRNDGTVFAWGIDPATNVPPGLANVKAIASGYSHGLALLTNGTVVAWGSGSGTNLPPGLTNVTAISASYFQQGQSLSMALRSNGTVVAWGDNPYGETNPPAALSNLLSVAIAAVPYHGLALVNDGSPQILQPPIGLTAYTGRNVTLPAVAAGAAPLSYQWLLNGTNLPAATNTTLSIANLQVADAGAYQLLVSNSFGTALSLPAPLNVITNNKLIFLSQPASQTNNQGTTLGFGVTVLGSGPLSYQWYFSTNNEEPFDYLQISVALSGATNDSLNFNPALAANSGYYFCVVSNQFDSATSSPFYLRVLFAKAWGPFAVDPPFVLTNATAIALGNYGEQSLVGAYLALSSAGKISSWGSAEYGETNFSGLSNSIVTAIAAGFGDALALKSDGTLFASGYHNFGETNIPVSASGITAIACGDYHDLALNYFGTVIGWGQNSELQATNNTTITNAVAIAAGGESSMALHADGSVVTWGFESGQLPYNLTNVVSIACGNGFFLALRANGTVVGWGQNNYGQTTIPLSWSNIVAVSAGANHSTFLHNDGTVMSLGYELSGFASNNIPPNLANVIAIASSGDRDLALFGTRAPVFTVQPWNRTVIFNSRTNIVLAGKCVGVQPVHYQWQFNGTNLPGATNDTLALTNQTFPYPPIITQIHAGNYQLIASNAYGVVASKYAQVSVLIPLGTALNATNLSWTTSGEAAWFGETNVTHDGVAAAQSGDIGPFQETDLETSVTTNDSGSYTFWWKVSSEQDFDFLEFRINGIVQTNISGEVNWQQVSIHVPAGTNLLEWRYYKDDIYASGQDAGWVDQFAYVADPPAITLQPLSQTVNMGTNVTFRVAATGPKLGYQWWFNGLPIGYNSPSLTLDDVGRSQDGTYSVTVTGFGIGSTVSSNANLVVLVPQLLGTPQLQPDGSILLTSGDVDGGQIPSGDLANFEAQVSTNLVDWITLPNSLILTNGMLQLQDGGNLNSPTRFYRIIEH